MRRRLAGLAALLLLTGCGGSDGTSDEPEDESVGAGVACEQFVERRAGADVEHGDWQEADVTGEGDGPYVVQSRFSAGGTWNVYRCEVERTSDGWRLIDLKTDR